MHLLRLLIETHADGVARGLKLGFEIARKHPEAVTVNEALTIENDKN